MNIVAGDRIHPNYDGLSLHKSGQFLRIIKNLYLLDDCLTNSTKEMQHMMLNFLEKVSEQTSLVVWPRHSSGVVDSIQDQQIEAYLNKLSVIMSCRLNYARINETHIEISKHKAENVHLMSDYPVYKRLVEVRTPAPFMSIISCHLFEIYRCMTNSCWHLRTRVSLLIHRRKVW